MGHRENGDASGGGRNSTAKILGTEEDRDCKVGSQKLKDIYLGFTTQRGVPIVRKSKKEKLGYKKK